MPSLAHILPGHRVLDPFCGTGSLLLSAASLGAFVVGSDIDADCLGLVDRESIKYTDRSKNSNFIRTDEYQSQQAEGSTLTNFQFYNLTSQLVALYGRDANEWCSETAEDHEQVMLSFVHQNFDLLTLLNRFYY